MELLKKQINKHEFLFASFLFSIVFIINYLPFFIYIPVPGIGWDTYDYFWFAQKVYLLQLPILDAPSDLPMGYPIFLAICKWFSMNIIHIAFVQTVLFYLACISLIYQTRGLFKYAAIIAAFSLSLYIVQPFVIRNTFTLYPDSLYGTSLIFLTASLFAYYLKQNIHSFILVLLGVMFSVLLRSNGIIQFFIPLVLLVFIVKERHSVKYYLISFMLMFAFLSSINLITKAYFFPGEFNRVNNVIKSIKEDFTTPAKNNIVVSSDTAGILQGIQVINVSENGTITYLTVDTTETGRIIHQVRYTQTRPVIYKEYIKFFSAVKPSFYYSLMPALYKGGITSRRPEVDSVLFDGRHFIDDFAPDLRNFVYSNYDYLEYTDKKFSEVVDYQRADKNILMLLSHFIYQIIEKSKLNLVLYIFFWIFFGFSVYYCIKKRSLNNICFFVVATSLIYIIHLILLPIMHARVQERYLLVTEFVIYLNAVFGIYVLVKHLIGINKVKKDSCSTKNP